MTALPPSATAHQSSSSTTVTPTTILPSSTTLPTSVTVSDIRSYMHKPSVSDSTVQAEVEVIDASTSSTHSGGTSVDGLERLIEMFPSKNEMEFSRIFRENRMDLEATIHSILGASGNSCHCI